MKPATSSLFACLPACLIVSPLPTSIRTRRNVCVLVLLAMLGTSLLHRSAQAQTVTVLHKFHWGDGLYPATPLILDAAGNLYGTTFYGGSFSCDPDLGGGVIFKIDTAGTFSVLHAFTNRKDLCNPISGLIMDSAGDFYGETYSAVFKMDPGGTVTNLYTFTGPPDGEIPQGGLLLDAEGNLYGTTSAGGNSSCSFALGCGTVFKLDPNGKETILYSFTGGADGAAPSSGLIQDEAGNLYGTTSLGGDLGFPSGCGTVFELDASGNETALYTFLGGADGCGSTAGLIRDDGGNLYGVTSGGGDLNCAKERGYGCGVVFRLDTRGKETILHAFIGKADGIGPASRLLRDEAGNFYGTTDRGGDYDQDGTVFKLDTSLTESILLRFNLADGATPYGGVIRDAAGNLYGTARNGGSLAEAGTVFKLTP